MGSGCGGQGRKSFSSRCGVVQRPSRMASGTRAGQGAHPLALLRVGHAPPLQHQLQVLGGRVAARGQPLEPADSGQLRQRPELLPQHVLQHFRRRGDYEAGQGVHGGARVPRAAGLSSGAPGAARGPRGRGGRGLGHLLPFPCGVAANRVPVRSREAGPGIAF